MKYRRVLPFTLLTFVSRVLLLNFGIASIGAGVKKLAMYWIIVVAAGHIGNFTASHIGVLTGLTDHAKCECYFELERYL